MSRRSFGRCLAVGTVALMTVAGIAAQTPERQAGPLHPSMKGMSEAEFVPMMIKHHQDGIEMARLEEQKGSSAEVKALAAKIRQSQDHELTELKQHSQDATAAPQGTSGREGHEKMMEQQSQATMKRLESASGQAVDHAFLEEMAKHHEMAIDMTEGAKIQTPALKQLTQKMVAGQRKELSELKKLEAAHARPK
jgi:uncharacterized protein (DUF305 family)